MARHFIQMADNLCRCKEGCELGLFAWQESSFMACRLYRETRGALRTF
jgi:hypothetical protein